MVTKVVLGHLEWLSMESLDSIVWKVPCSTVLSR